MIRHFSGRSAIAALKRLFNSTSVRPESKSYGSYDMEVVRRQASSETDQNSENGIQLEPVAVPNETSRSEESSLVTKAVDRNHFEGWFEFMRFVEKCLTGVFAFLLIILPVIIGSLVNKRISQPDN